MKNYLGVLFKLLNKFNFKNIINTLFALLIAVLGLLLILFLPHNNNLFIKEYRNIAILAGLVISLIIVLLLLFLFIYIINSVNRITKHAEILAKGKLNISDINIRGNNSFSVLAKAIDDMKSNIIFFVDNTKNNIITLSDSIENMLKSMEIAHEGNRQIASTMEGISQKSQIQLDLVKDSVYKTDEISKSTNLISEHIEDVKDIASDTNLVSVKGKKTLNNYNDSMKLISQSVEDTAEFISKLKLNAKEIEDVVKFIVELSEQLKMLSLNASIEASRAGEVGKGFTVVAHEITNLSENTKDGIDKINQIVKNILSNSDSVEQSIETSVNSLKNGNEIFSNVKEIFDEINDKNSKLLNQVKEIATEMLSINTNTRSNVILNEKVNEISEVVSESTEESVAVIEEELAEFQEINESMNAIQSLLPKIEKLATKFDLDIKAVTDMPKKPLEFIVLMPNFGDVWDIMRFGILYGSKVLKHKNTKVKIIPINSRSNDDVINAINSIRDCVKNKCDGIIMPGFYEEQMQEIVNANIPIITFNVDIKAKNKRIAFVGQNSYESGKIAAKVMIEQVGTKGNVVIVTADMKHDVMELRKKGVIEVIEKNKKFNITDILEIPFDNEKAYLIIKEYLKKNNNISGIINVAGGIDGLASAIKEHGIQDKVKTIVYDTTENIFNYINKGILTCTIGQDPFRQGYDPLIYLYNYLVTGEKPDIEKTWTKIETIDRNNVRHFLN